MLSLGLSLTPWEGKMLNSMEYTIRVETRGNSGDDNQASEETAQGQPTSSVNGSSPAGTTSLEDVHTGLGSC